MMSYRDMTFCSGNGCLNFDNCHRKLTKEVIERAERAGLLIAQYDEPEKLDCYEKPKTKKK